MPKKYVWVMPAVLGLSPLSNGGFRMRGEVYREFIHVVTGEDMLLVYFSSVIGQMALAKRHCVPDDANGAGPSSPFRSQRARLGPSSPARFGRTQQQLFEQFQAAGNNSVMDTVGPSQSPKVGVTLPNYLMPTGVDEDSNSDSGSDVDDPEWVARYNDFAGQSDSGNSD